MRYLRYLWLASVAFVFVILALANRGSVTLATLPDGLAQIPGMSVLALSAEVPLFAVLFGGVVLGLVLGLIWEWFREHKHRADASRKTAEVNRLQRELKKAKGPQGDGADDVLALLDKAS
jgi:putative membrane protein